MKMDLETTAQILIAYHWRKKAKRIKKKKAVKKKKDQEKANKNKYGFNKSRTMIAPIVPKKVTAVAAPSPPPIVKAPTLNK